MTKLLRVTLVRADGNAKTFPLDGGITSALVDVAWAVLNYQSSHNVVRAFFACLDDAEQFRLAELDTGSNPWKWIVPIK